MWISSLGNKADSFFLYPRFGLDSIIAFSNAAEIPCQMAARIQMSPAMPSTVQPSETIIAEVHRS